MKSLSPTQKHTILTKLDAGHLAHSIASTTGVNVSTITRLCSKKHSELQKSSSGCLSKLSPANIQYAIYFIIFQKAENAVQVTKTLTNIINKPLSPSTVCLHLKKAGIKAVVKTKCPLLSTKHRKAYFDFAYIYKDWTLDD